MSVADRMAILEEGAISQVGTSVEIYDGPANEYVARLLGSPMMNIVPAHRDTAGSAFEAAEGAIRLPVGMVPEETASLGIRPENLKVTPWSDGTRGRPAKVFEVEPLGGHTVVTLEAGGQMLKALMRGQPQIAAQSPVSLSCSPEQMHFFGATGVALAR